MRFLLVLTFLLAFNFVAFGQNDGIPQELKQLSPLVSTRQSVEQLLGKPVKTFSNIADYKTENGEYTAYYSEGKCEQSVNTSKYNVEKDILIKIHFYSEKRIPVSRRLKTILKGFSESITDDVSPKASYFENEYQGLAYGIFDNKIVSIAISPKKGLWHLGCDRINSDRFINKQVDDR
jgi:hypothetical protein